MPDSEGRTLPSDCCWHCTVEPGDECPDAHSRPCRRCTEAGRGTSPNDDIEPAMTGAITGRTLTSNEGTAMSGDCHAEWCPVNCPTGCDDCLGQLGCTCGAASAPDALYAAPDIPQHGCCACTEADWPCCYDGHEEKS